MDNEMIEKVAKEIKNNWLTKDIKDIDQFFIYLAEAAIKALREPTNKMIDERGYTPSYHDGMIADETAKMCWQTMIDSIINEQ